MQTENNNNEPKYMSITSFRSWSRSVIPENLMKRKSHYSCRNQGSNVGTDVHSILGVRKEKLYSLLVD